MGREDEKIHIFESVSHDLNDYQLNMVSVSDHTVLSHVKSGIIALIL